jgi:hypothetical protein
VALPAVIVVITVAVLTLLILGGTVLMLLARLRELAGTVTELRDDLQPGLESLRAASEVARGELERVSEAASDLRGDSVVSPGQLPPDRYTR